MLRVRAEHLRQRFLIVISDEIGKIGVEYGILLG